MIKVGNVEVKAGQFPDHSLLVKFNPYDEDFECDRGAIKFEWYYENDAELFTLICLKRHIDQHYSKGSVLLLPYIPHARMDRTKNDEDVFTLKYFCEVINSLHFEIVWVRDAHSNVSLALLNNVQQEPIEYFIATALSKSGADAVFFPDEGAMKRYSGMLAIPYAFGMKCRDWETGKIIGYDIVHSDNIDGKNVIIIDDICSRGGTFYHASKALKEAGAKNISLYVTHCENTIHQGELLTSGLIEKVYTTNSIFTEEHDKIEVI
jgi:ribose-phosphate pyrophosphokinase